MFHNHLPYPYAPPFFPPVPQYHPNFFPQYGGPPPQLSQSISPMCSPRAALRLNVPLSEFCSRYGISDSDHVKLEQMEYKPGNRAVETLDEGEWKAEFKFTKLGWQGFLDAHKTFLKDVRDGNWVVV